MDEKIKASLIIEILGRPPEHIKESLNTMVIKMGSEKGVKLIDKKYHDPKPVEKTEDLFMSFAEVEAEFDSLEAFFGTIFSYMPAHVEIHSPEKLKTTAGDLNGLANFILGKLHKYDTMAKRLVGERNILIKQLEVLTGKAKVPEKVKESIKESK